MSNNNNNSDKNAPDPGVSKTAEQRPKSSGPSGKTIALILGIVAIICVSGLAFAYMMLSQPQAAVAEKEREYLPMITQENVEDIKSQLDEKVERGMFQTFMTTNWVFPDGESPATAGRMGNSASNNYDFYFTLSVDDEVVLTSGILPVGSEMAEIVLDTDLPAGDYNAVLTVHMIDEEGEEIDSNVGFNISLSVLG